MAHAAWEDASDYRDIKKKPYYSIKHLSQLTSLNIRQLKQLATQINEHLGLTITKQLSAQLGQSGKTISSLRKAELIECIWYVRQVQMSRPTERGEWVLDRLSDRIYSFVSPQGESWVYYLACDAEEKRVGKRVEKRTGKQVAHRLYEYLMSKNRCGLASYRTGDRTYGDWELKVWGLNPNTLALLLERDTPAPEPEPQMEEQPAIPNLETLEQRCQRYNNIIANGGGIGLKHVQDQLRKNPHCQGLVIARGKVVIEDEF